MRAVSSVVVSVFLALLVISRGASGGDKDSGKKVDQRELDTRMARERAAQLKLDDLTPVDVDAVTRDGLGQAKVDFSAVLKEADERIQAIQQTKDYPQEDVELLAQPWILTKQFVELLRDGKRLPEIELKCDAVRDGAMYSGGTCKFNGNAKRACEIMREIGLKDTANGKSWSRMWGHMERRVVCPGRLKSGDLAVKVDVVLGVNQWEFIYKQVYNVKTIERYAERDLGDGRYVIIQDLLADDSQDAKPRGADCKPKFVKKDYYPCVEQISITVIRDNKDGTFTLGNFMSTKAQPLQAITGGGKFASLFIDLLKTTKEDTVKNRKVWNDLFQKEVLRPKGEGK